jgi:hypothetical protein
MVFLLYRENFLVFVTSSKNKNYGFSSEVKLLGIGTMSDHSLCSAL